MESLVQDIRFALRSLRRRPTFAAVALLTIALAIGSATSIYSVVDGVLFRSLPGRDAGRIVAIWQTDESRKKQAILAANWDRVPLDYTDFITWRATQKSFAGVGVWSGWGWRLTNEQGQEQVAGGRVSPGLLEMLGAVPVLGRTFLPGEDVPGGPRVTMLSFEAWQARFGGRRDIVGQTVRLDETPYQIIGVLPEGFTLERGKPAAPFWVPAGQAPGDIGQRNRSFRALGRIAPGVTLEQATLETQASLNANDSETKRGVRITPFVRDETRDVRAPMLVLLGAVGLLLLIACVNMATLLLGETASRDMEISARLALGATRARIIRQLLTESLLLSLVGGALGAMLAWWGTRGIIALAPPKIPGILAAHVDARVLGVATLIAVVNGLLFGAAPALSWTRGRSASLLRVGQTVRGRGDLQRWMIGIELAFSVVLLTGAGLVARSLQKLSAVDPGFRADHLAAVRISYPNPSGDTIALRQFYADAFARIATLPGVVAVTAGSNIPFTNGSSSSPLLLPGEGQAEMKARKHEVQQRVIAANYFAVMGIPVIAGRAFDESDRSGGPLAAIISEAAARRDFPNESAIGKLVKYQGAWRQVVGVVQDVKYNRLSMPDQASIYTPMTQRTSVMDLVVRTNADAESVAKPIREILRELDPGVIVANVDAVPSLITRSFAEERFRTMLIGLFAAIAAVLAAVGMYGVTARAVTRRTREVGIRVALGATSRSVSTMIARQTLAGVLIGVSLGVLASFGAATLLSPYLFGITPHDPATFGAVLAFLTTVSAVATWLPARRAGRVEPATVLRNE
jgi:putative ABC transport system permease protein